LSIPDPKTATKEKGEKNLFSLFFVAANITKLKIILFLSRGRKNFFTNLQRIILPKTLSLSSQTFGFGIRNAAYLADTHLSY
jgi:hypothetical protein